VIVIPDEGKIELHSKTLRAALAVGENYVLRLYRNDVSPNAASTLATFSEATFPGYFRQDLPRAGWTVPVIVDGRAVSEFEGNVVSWVATSGSQLIYGYYVVAPLTAVVVWAERFTDPVDMNTGRKLIVLPRLTGRDDV